MLMRIVLDSNHIAQELTALGKEPKVAFESILKSGHDLQDTKEAAFYSDVQRIKITNDTELFCFQFPCGGNVYILCTPKERVMFDTGFGIYHHAITDMLPRFGLDSKELTRIYLTHSDADHCGGSGFYDVPCYIHPGSVEGIRTSNRACGSKMEGSILGEVYTKLINLFSDLALRRI